MATRDVDDWFNIDLNDIIPLIASQETISDIASIQTDKTSTELNIDNSPIAFTSDEILPNIDEEKIIEIIPDLTSIGISQEESTMIDALAKTKTIDVTTRKAYPIKFKNNIIRQIFVKSGMLEDLGKKYNCQIIFKNKDGRYALFIRPNPSRKREEQCNYMINATNGYGGNPEEDRIFFNLSKINPDLPRGTLIPTEYLSEYVFKNYAIHHVYESKGTPTKLKKNQIMYNKTETIYNAYVEINKIIKANQYNTKFQSESYNLTGITKDFSQDDIQKLIRIMNNTIPSFKFDSNYEKIIECFKNKKAYDDMLRDALKANNRIHWRGHKFTHIEEVVNRPKTHYLFETNNYFTDLLASRYASYYP